MDKWWDSPALSVSPLGNRSPLTITRLDFFSFPIAIGSSNNHTSGDHTHHKPGLVKVIYIFVKDTVFGFSVMYKCKPLANNFWIFAFGPLVVASTYKKCPELWLAFDEGMSPEFADRGRVAFT